MLLWEIIVLYYFNNMENTVHSVGSMQTLKHVIRTVGTVHLNVNLSLPQAVLNLLLL
jgi:hypothetical protein